eukprot:snap_masked-scaffold_60-processed-gene-0.26-mRNA-1 protein AED:1.00 eAED:1.00 QI:0/0/0/0/1/1/2/0/59
MKYATPEAIERSGAISLQSATLSLFFWKSSLLNVVVILLETSNSSVLRVSAELESVFVN